MQWFVWADTTRGICCRDVHPPGHNILLKGSDSQSACHASCPYHSMALEHSICPCVHSMQPPCRRPSSLDRRHQILKAASCPQSPTCFLCRTLNHRLHPRPPRESSSRQRRQGGISSVGSVVGVVQGSVQKNSSRQRQTPTRQSYTHNQSRYQRGYTH